MAKNLSFLFVALILSAVLISGCGSDDDSATSEPKTIVIVVTATAEPSEPTAPTTAPTAAPEGEYCEDASNGARLSYQEAIQIAQNSECSAQGALKETHTCNSNTGTWWIDLEMDAPNCSPACVVYVSERRAEINWRCTGALPPADEAPDVSYQGISFSYDDAIASGVLPEQAPAEPLMGDIGDMPAHIQFVFEGYALSDRFHPARIHIYPLAALQAEVDPAGRIVAELQQLLAEKPPAPENIPFMPVFNAAQIMRAQVSYVDFASGTGVRFITQYAQAFMPINNSDLFYTFQGLTHDGQYYVAAILPVSHPSLPADGSQVPDGDWNAFAEGFEDYIIGLVQELDSQPAASFGPDLSLLDAMIQSLKIEGGPNP